MITISLNPANISLSRDIVFTFGGSVVSSGRFSVPTSVTLTSGQPAVAFSVSGLSDKVLYNDADLVLNANSVYLGSLSTALSIVDVTALNPDNRVLTIGNGTIYNSDMISMTVSLPVGITTARQYHGVRGVRLQFATDKVPANHPPCHAIDQDQLHQVQDQLHQYLAKTNFQ
jgi:hypothetical protein